MSNNLTSDLVEIPNAPNVPGLAFRHFRGEADYAVIAAVQTASNRADRVEEAIGREEVANDFAHLVNCDPDRDYIFGEVNGETVAYAKVSWRINAEGQRIYWQWGYVVPEWRRKGIGRALLNYTEARARLRAQATPIPGSSFVRGLSEDTAYGKTALFENSQYPIIRYFCFMGRKDLHDLPAAPLPAGLAFRPARPKDWPAIWQAKEEAFRDHWGYAPKSEAEYQHWLNDPLHRPHLWQIVWDVAKNEIAAISQNEIMGVNPMPILHRAKRFRIQQGWTAATLHAYYWLPLAPLRQPKRPPWLPRRLHCSTSPARWPS